VRHPVERITQTNPNYPVGSRAYLKTETPEVIWTRGNINWLPGQKTNLNRDFWALFCSSRCPAEIISKTHDLAQEFKEAGIPTNNQRLSLPS